jgi:hypothetical protein
VVFRTGLDLGPALRAVRKEGAAFVPRSLDESFRRRLWGEVRGGPFQHMVEEFGGGRVRQQLDAFDVVAPFDGFQLLAELCRELTSLVREQGRGIRGLATWTPNEVGAARYRPGSFGITPHLDGKWYRRLVAVVTLNGSARFSICRDRAGPAVAEWEAGPGSLVLMRAPGLGGLRDGRPFHMAAGPRRGERCSVGLRMSTRLEAGQESSGRPS